LKKKSNYIHPISEFKNSKSFGEKTQGIKFLLKRGFFIPKTWICSTKAYMEFLLGNSSLAQLLENEIESKLDLNKNYAIRSSANLEDLPFHSFAGQFKTILNVKGKKNIIAAINEVWKSATTDSIRNYAKKSNLSLKNIKIDVIIQEMVKAKTSGVVFTKNPIDGKDEIIIEAIVGLGDTLVQDGVNPYRGVYKWGRWIKKPAIPDLPENILEKILIESKKLENEQGQPINLEWSYDGKSLFWLQIRKITTLNEVNIYSNKMAKEFLPGTIKPLVWSINIPVVCGAWIRLLSEVINDLNIKPEDLAKQFYYRAYFNMGLIGQVLDQFGVPKESIERIMGYGKNAPKKPFLKPGPKMLMHLPKLLIFCLDKIFFSRKMSQFIKLDSKNVKNICKDDKEIINPSETIKIIQQLLNYNRKAAYFVIVSQLLSAVLNRFLTIMLKKEGKIIQDLDFSSSFNRDINLNPAISKLHQKYSKLSKNEKEAFEYYIKNGLEPPKTFRLIGLIKDFNKFLLNFGHLSDQGNDFSRVTWKENPSLVFELIIHHGNIHNFHKTHRRRNKRNVLGLISNFLYNKTKQSLEDKERIGFIYTRNYGLFRKYFLDLSKFFRINGYYGEIEDIFFLTFDEVKMIVKEGTFPDELNSKLARRKEEITNLDDTELPEVIFGDSPPIPIKRNFEVRNLSGISASIGYHTGNSCVVEGVHDFSKVNNGDVVIVPFSDISWTPIFTKAGAVISESGGILSHSAIITREYKIPCVVGVQGACKLGDGKTIHVDGYLGKITVE